MNLQATLSHTIGTCQADLSSSGGNPQPLAVRPKEAAKLLRISEKTLFNLTKRGELRAVRLGTAKQSGVLYPIAELQRFLAERLSDNAADSAPQGSQS